MKISFKATPFGPGIGDTLQMMSLIAEVARSETRTVAVHIADDFPHREACLNCPGVEYVLGELSQEDRLGFHAFENMPSDRREWWRFHGASWANKRMWCPRPSPEAEILGRFHWRPGARRILIQNKGGHPDKTYQHWSVVASLLSQNGSRVEYLDQVGSLDDMFGLIASADLFVGFDSGPFYAALGLGIPSVGLFCAQDPHELYLPVKRPQNRAIYCPGDPSSVRPFDLVREIETVWAASRFTAGMINERDGLFWFDPGDIHDANLAWMGHEADLIAQTRFRPGQMFVDVGAHVGAYTLHAAKEGAKVLAFEPHPANHGILEKNLEINGLSHFVNARQIAISDRRWMMPLVFAGGQTHAGDRAWTIREITTEVLAMPLDFFLEGYPRLDWLKIDVEGHEARVLSGAIESIKALRPKILLEIHDRLGPNPAPQLREQCLRFLADLGYAGRPLNEAQNNWKFVHRPKGEESWT